MRKYFEKLPPNERITKIIEEYFKPILENNNFIFSKSQKRFKRKLDFFENHISFFNNRHNYGNESVDFEIYITIHSPKYYKWEKDFYALDSKSPENSIDGNRCFALENWNTEHSDETWYNLVEFDNEKIVETIIENFENSALPYFEKFRTLESGIEYLLGKSDDGKFLTIFDLLIISENFDLAKEYFGNNNAWFEEEIKKNDDKSYFGMNYKNSYLLRKKVYENIKKQQITSVSQKRG